MLDGLPERGGLSHRATSGNHSAGSGSHLAATANPSGSESPSATTGGRSATVGSHLTARSADHPSTRIGSRSESGTHSVPANRPRAVSGSHSAAESVRSAGTANANRSRRARKATAACGRPGSRFPLAAMRSAARFHPLPTRTGNHFLHVRKAERVVHLCRAEKTTETAKHPHRARETASRLPHALTTENHFSRAGKIAPRRAGIASRLRRAAKRARFAVEKDRFSRARIAARPGAAASRLHRVREDGHFHRAATARRAGHLRRSAPAVSESGLPDQPKHQHPASAVSGPAPRRLPPPASRAPGLALPGDPASPLSGANREQVRANQAARVREVQVVKARGATHERSCARRLTLALPHTRD